MKAQTITPPLTLIALALGALGCESYTYTLDETEATCADAFSHVESCTGTFDPVFEANCETEDTKLILETPCELLIEASRALPGLKADGYQGSSFACRVFNIGCPESEASVPEVNLLERQALIALSEPDSVWSPEDVRFRVNSIASIFRESGDPRGLFATVYRLITNRALESVEAGDYAHPEWARDLITEFGRRYLANLHGHLTEGEVTGQWAKYYGLAQDAEVGRGRTLGVAIAVHLMVDLPYTLEMIGSTPEQREDFIRFGDILLEVFPDLITDVQADYDTDASGLLNGFFIGEWVDGVTSEGTMTAFLYQGVRMKAWRDGQNLRHFPEWLVAAEIRSAWGFAEITLATLDAQGAL